MEKLRPATLVPMVTVPEGKATPNEPLTAAIDGADVAAGLRGRLAVSVSAVVAPVKTRLPNVATPAVVEAVAGEVARSALASVAPMLTELAVNRAPLSVRVTAGAGDIGVPVRVPVEGGSPVKLMA